MSTCYHIGTHCKPYIYTGKLEGINDKIKAIKRKACGDNHLPYLAFKIIAATSTNS